MRVLLLCWTSSNMVDYICSGVEGLKRDEFGVVVCCTGLPVPLFVSCPCYSRLLSIFVALGTAMAPCYFFLVTSSGSV